VGGALAAHARGRRAIARREPWYDRRRTFGEEGARMTARIMLAVLALGYAAAVASADDDGPTPLPARPPGRAEAKYNEGRALARQNDWTGAERAYREAARLDPALPEAWNGLGFALRKQSKYAESVRAYEEALRLRPQYPQALEYLGEAYVQMGRLDAARATLERLRPLDPQEAEELAQAIARASKR
jgi:tetratricopeptide (TPR) repeat protein